MQVLLKSDVDHLGYKGDVVDVKRGYWRNYLRPRNFAETATAEKVRELTEAMERRRSVDASNAGEANTLKELLDRTTVTVSALATPQGTLFGSVAGPEIARVLEATRKLRLDPKKVVLDEPIKALGTFQVPVDLGHGVKAELTVEVEESKLSAQEIARLEAERRNEENAIEAARLKAEARAAAGNAPAAPAEGEDGEAAEGDAEATDADAVDADAGDDAAADATAEA
ncbi:MAG: ribosomal protein [Thermoleophilia bacterium]|nr:ribosomal protein [Thermoleophilia bacterium]